VAVNFGTPAQAFHGGFVADYVKLHTDILDNPKFERIPADLIKPWLKCLVIARLYGGVLPDLQTVAYRLRVDQATAATWLSRLQKGHLLDPVGQGGDLQPHDWDFWNPPNPVDRTNAERQKRFREKKRNAVTQTIEPNLKESNVTEGVTALRNETVTPLRNAVTIYPSAEAFLTEKYPATDGAFARSLFQGAEQAFAAVSTNGAMLTDAAMRRALEIATQPGQTSAALYKRTLPAVIINELKAHERKHK